MSFMKSPVNIEYEDQGKGPLRSIPKTFVIIPVGSRRFGGILLYQGSDFSVPGVYNSK
jgi:hypothetical protein